MELDKMLPAMMGGLAAMIGLTAVAGMAQAGTPTPPTPPVSYSCPVCNETFASYEDLYSHFTTQHPSDPIEIVWE